MEANSAHSAAVAKLIARYLCATDSSFRVSLLFYVACLLFIYVCVWAYMSVLSQFGVRRTSLRWVYFCREQLSLAHILTASVWQANILIFFPCNAICSYSSSARINTNKRCCYFWCCCPFLYLLTSVECKIIYIVSWCAHTYFSNKYIF